MPPPESLPDSSPAAHSPTADLDVTVRVDMRTHLPAGIEQPGDRISHYELVVVLGEGGFGTVWQARQSEPIRREVALKLIKPGMDSREILARFETEKQTLARMEHPNIAGVLDAGTTETGRPYFVMELIQGVPITEYCDAKHLSLRQRLELFIPVCHAVQHAHQKAVLHRDLKPSNILVTEVDGRAVPKVIDFGIAKALSGTAEQVFQTRLAHTMEGLVIGTPQYMSPEQAGAKADIDTRSDIYTLGVILYELLTGTTPLTRDELKRTAFDEMLRLVREHESVRPSSRVQPLSAADTRTCTSFGMEPGRLTRLLRGDLDWITLKALEKDRERRYETANALAEDIQRHLNQEPVSAAAPSAAYRLKKLIRRNRAAFAAAAAIVITLVAATGFSVWQADRATRAEKDTRDALLVAERHRNEAQTNLALARKAVDDYLNNVTDNPVLKKADLTGLRRELLETALPFYEKFIQQRSDEPSLRREQAIVMCKLGDIYVSLGKPGEAESIYKRALAFQKEIPAELQTDPEYLRVISSIGSNAGNAMAAQGKRDEAEPALRQAIAGQERLVADHPAELINHLNLAKSLAKLGIVWREQGRVAEAESLHRRAIEILQRLVQATPGNVEHSSYLAGLLMDLGVVLRDQSREDDAMQVFQEARGIMERLAGGNPPGVEEKKRFAALHRSMGVQFRELGRVQESVQALQQGKAILEQLVADFPSIPQYRQHLATIENDLGNPLGDLGRVQESEAAFRRAVEMRESLVKELPEVAEVQYDCLNSLNNLGVALDKQRKFAEALPHYRQALEVGEKLVARHPDMPGYRAELASVHTNLGMLHFQQNELVRASPEFREALAMREKLEKDFPGLSGNQVYLAGAYHNLAMVLHKEGQARQARELYEKAIAMQHDTLARSPADSRAQRYLRNHHAKRAPLCIELGDLEAAVQSALEVSRLGAKSPYDQVYAASLVSQCVLLVARDPAVSSADRTDVEELHARQAVELLRGAVSLGFKEFDKVKADPAFAPIVKRADFQEIILP